MTEHDRAAVIAIAESLPEWFDETARQRSIPADIRHHTGFVAVVDDAVVGFITLYVFEGRLNISWLGVRKDVHRQGVGKALLRQAEALALGIGITEIATYTLGDGVDYPPYEKTRRFYFDNGFEVYQRSKTDNPGCPEEIRIKKTLGALPGLKCYTEANREAWNEVAPLHQKAARQKWDDAFMAPGFVCLSDVELSLLGRMGIKDKAVAHPCCNNGIELLSLKNLGAGKCVGFDISDVAVREATERAKKSRIDCKYVRSDVYEIGSEYENRFDVVYLSSGALGWIPDLKLFFAKVADLLREDGRVFIHEIHPLSEMLPIDSTNPTDPLRITESYFRTEPYIDYGGMDYVGGSQYASTRPQYWFMHKLSDILMGLIENRISIEHFSEYEKDISAGHRRVEQARAGIPLSYIMIGKKHGTDKPRRAPETG